MKSINGYTQNAWAGDKYEETKYMRTKDIAALIRKDIAERFPRKQGYKFSVKTSVFAGGSSIDVRVVDAPESLFDYFGRNTEYAKNICKEVKSIINEYRYDDSDGMIDYFCTNFYGHCDVAYDSPQNLGYKVYNERYAQAEAV